MVFFFWWGIAMDFRSERKNKEYIIEEFLKDSKNYQIDTIYVVSKDTLSVTYKVKKLK